MHGKSPAADDAAALKNRGFRDRLGFALAGIGLVFRRERSFRTQVIFAAVALCAAAGLRLGPLWLAILLLCIGIVLALEAVNAALEYLADHLHPRFAAEIGHAKDAAAGAVVIASGVAAAIGALAVLDWAGLA